LPGRCQVFASHQAAPGSSVIIPKTDAPREKIDTEPALAEALRKDPFLRSMIEDIERQHARSASRSKVRATLPFPRRCLELPRNRGGVSRTGEMTPL